MGQGERPPLDRRWAPTGAGPPHTRGMWQGRSSPWATESQMAKSMQPQTVSAWLGLTRLDWTRSAWLWSTRTGYRRRPGTERQRMPVAAVHRWLLSSQVPYSHVGRGGSSARRPILAAQAPRVDVRPDLRSHLECVERWRGPSRQGPRAPSPHIACRGRWGRHRRSPW
jgi:hypothetical protein